MNILTKEEIIELTSTKHAKKQKRVLLKNGIHFFEDCDGKPKVLRENLKRKSNERHSES